MPRSRNLGAMNVRVEADTKQFRNELRQAESRIGRSAKTMRSSFNTVTKSTASLRAGFARVNAGVAVLAGAGGLGLLVKQSLDFADGIDKAASKLGVTTDFLQEARFAADQSGVAINTLEMAMQRFTRRAGEAANGTGEAQDAIAELGLSLRDTNGNLRSTEDLFRDALEALSGVDQPAERLRLAFKLFDSEGAVLVNLADDFNRLAGEAEAAGQVLGADTIRRAVDAKDQLAELSGQVKVLATESLVDLAPALLDTAQGLAEIANFAGQAWARLRDFYNADPKNIEEAKDRIGELKREIAALNGELTQSQIVADDPGARGPLSSVRSVEFVKRDLEARTNELREAQAQLERLQARTAAPGLTPTPTLQGGAALSKEQQRTREEREKGLEALRRQFEEEQRLASAQAVSVERLAEVRAAIEAENQIRTLGVDAKSAEADEIRALTAETEKLRLVTGDLEDEGVAAFDGITSSAERLRDGMGDAFSRMVFDGENAFKALGDSFIRDFVSRVAQQAVFSPVFSFLGLEGKRASGGPVRAGRPYLVGERGPEVVIPNANSYVVPNHRLGAATAGGSGIGGTTNVTVIHDGNTQAEVSDQSTGTGREVQIAIRQLNQRDGAAGHFDGFMQGRYGIRPKGRSGAS